MTIESLEYFYEIARGSNYLDAAEQFHVSQSTLSKNIRKLEIELHTQLFCRDGRSVKLTDTGKILLKDVEPMLTAYHKLRRDMDKALNFSHISCYIRPSVSVLNLKNVTSEFMKIYPWISVSLRDERNPASIISLLKDDIVDFVITHRLPHGFPDHKELVLTDDTIVILLPEDHPYASHQEIDLDDLIRETFYAIRRNSFLMQKTFEDLNLPGPNIIHTEMNREELLWKIAVDRHPSLMYATDIAPYNLRGVVARRIKGIGSRPYVLACNKTLELNEAQLLFVNYIIDNVRTMNI